MNKQACLKIGIGIGLVILGIITKRVFHLSALTLIFHLAGGVALAWGIVQWITERK